MGPRVGEGAPAISAISDDGRHIELSELRGRWVVLFFFPKSGSRGCSIEAQRFEAALPQFERLGASVIGVSTDTEAAQAKFRDQCQLSFALLPDSDKQVSRAYGVLGGVPGLLGWADRQTFLIDPQGQVAHHWKKVNFSRHAAEVLEELGKKTAPA